jgi:hypothetical protein
MHTSESAVFLQMDGCLLWRFSNRPNGPECIDEPPVRRVKLGVLAFEMALDGYRSRH